MIAASGAVWVGLLWVACAAGSAAPVPAAAPAAAGRQSPQGRSDAELAELRVMLGRAGPDGRQDRMTAVVRLLAMAAPEAHRLLQQELLRSEDPDELRTAILNALERHLLSAPASQFGGAAPEVRLQIVTGYLGALAPLWVPMVGGGEEVGDQKLRLAARSALQRVPGRELEAAARVLLGSPSIQAETKAALLRCLADLQQVMFAATIAEWIEAKDEVVRTSARRAIMLLTYADQPIETRAQFEAWAATFGNMRYVDLAERAARLGPQPLERLHTEMARLRVEAARDVVAAHVARTPGVDWAAVQQRTVVDDVAVLDACLELLQSLLVKGTPPEESSAARQQFCRALLQRFREVPPERQLRRALLLEVAAYLARPTETELATEIVAQLINQLHTQGAEEQVSALRGLRRFPNVETRTLLVRRARELLADDVPAHQQLAAILDTLASRSPPRWTAPLPEDPDKAEWLALVETGCRSDPSLDLRTKALTLSQMLDGREQRVPEVFALLLRLARDNRLDTKFRSTCLIYLQAWRGEPAFADQWLLSLHGLLTDPAVEIRLRAAESLALLPETTDPRRGEWLAASMTVLRDRMVFEEDANVLRALVDCVQIFGREPLMPEKAIGALNYVLGQLGQPVAQEHQFRLDPLLQALATVAADARADRGQWLGACGALLMHGKRQSLRLVLQSQAAIDLAKDVGSADIGVADRARQAMRVIIDTAALKSITEQWLDSEDLQREARDVRTAFGVLESAGQKFDTPTYRLLRLEVDLAGGKLQEVVQRARNLLSGANGNGAPAVAWAAEQLDRVRMIAAEAQLGLGRPDEALRLLDERGPDAAAAPGSLELTERIARAMESSDSASAVGLLERVVRATSPEDPHFRARLIQWIQVRIRLDPGSREAAIRDGMQYAALFRSPDCPPELRDAFDQLQARR